MKNIIFLFLLLLIPLELFAQPQSVNAFTQFGSYFYHDGGTNAENKQNSCLDPETAAAALAFDPILTVVQFTGLSCKFCVAGGGCATFGFIASPSCTGDMVANKSTGVCEGVPETCEDKFNNDVANGIDNTSNFLFLLSDLTQLPNNVSDGECNWQSNFTEGANTSDCGTIDGDTSGDIYCGVPYSRTPLTATDEPVQNTGEVVKDDTTESETEVVNTTDTVINPDGSTTTTETSTSTSTTSASSTNDETQTGLDMFNQIMEAMRTQSTETVTTTNADGSTSSTQTTTTTASGGDTTSTIIDESGTITSDTDFGTTATSTTVQIIETDADGNVIGSTTSTSTSGSETGSPNGDPNSSGQAIASSISNGFDCSTPLFCDGDAIDCAVLEYEKRQYCNLYGGITGGEDSLLDVKPENEVQKEVIDLSIQANDLDPTGFLGSACPAPITVNVKGTTLNFEYQPLCDLADLLRPLIIALGYFLSAIILFKGFTS